MMQSTAQNTQQNTHFAGSSQTTPQAAQSVQQASLALPKSSPTCYKIAILYICTGAYSIFWQDFYDSAKVHLLPAHRLTYFVFTDADSLYAEEASDVRKIYQENLGWPFNTLKRFEMFLGQEEALREFDFVFFFNANCLFFQHIGDEFLPIEEDILVTQHYGFRDASPECFTYERNPKSLAYVPFGKGKAYVYGSTNGGKAGAFLALVRTLQERIQEDLSRGIIAIWHDESHLNAYIIDHPNYKMLDYGYGFPEGYGRVPGGGVYIFLRDKSRVIDVNAIKGMGSPANRRLKNALRKLKHFSKRLLGR
ncbi:family 6 glucosyltransferase [Helicobacter mustelae]|uniref:family 6 glucosyltransferase n=1 Tax=Helicobacter mustelae TaxID=217 RepID=UPI000E0F53D6|nr:family 6 glucosyltransferase [Helicobacter mustelae]